MVVDKSWNIFFNSQKPFITELKKIINEKKDEICPPYGSILRPFSLPLDKINNYGSSLIYGHPQGPTAGRLIIEGIEEAVIKGGGYMLWAGCAAGDTAASIILKIG